MPLSIQVAENVPLASRGRLHSFGGICEHENLLDATPLSAESFSLRLNWPNIAAILHATIDGIGSVAQAVIVQGDLNKVRGATRQNAAGRVTYGGHMMSTVLQAEQKGPALLRTILQDFAQKTVEASDHTVDIVGGNIGLTTDGTLERRCIPTIASISAEVTKVLGIDAIVSIPPATSLSLPMSVVVDPSLGSIVVSRRPRNEFTPHTCDDAVIPPPFIGNEIYDRELQWAPTLFSREILLQYYWWLGVRQRLRGNIQALLKNL